MSDEVTLDAVVNLAKRRGFVFAGSDIYGGLANSWDYGPLGVELKNAVKRAWWRRFVGGRLDVVGIDAALIMNPKVWEASGHLETFNDPLVECRGCHERFREDQIDTTAACPSCGQREGFTEPAAFNLMFKTFMGPKEEAANTVYLRPETAQGMFVDFPLVQQTTRQRIPFGIAQIGKAFRNEITPGNFIFRTREFEQMEIEYFVHPDTWEEHFEAWRAAMHEWMSFCGIDAKRVHELEVPAEELAHYSKRTVDFEFDFPFGRDELYGLAYRTDFDLMAHATASGKNMSYTDPATGETYVPHVIEPTWGVDRTVLTMLLSAYHEEPVKSRQERDHGPREDMRTVLRLPSWAAPYQVAVLPLSRKPELEEVARPLAKELAAQWSVDYDVTQSIGKRYRRQDEIGTPWCVTVDFDSLDDQEVTIRERDSMKQERVPVEKVVEILSEKLKAQS